MQSLLPNDVVALLLLFACHFKANNHAYFAGWILGLWVLGTTRKCVTNIAKAAFFVDRSVANWERFVSEYRWDLYGVWQTLVNALTERLHEKLLVYGEYLAVIDTTLIAKLMGKMPAVQRWQNHSGNAQKGQYLVGHHWAMIGLVCCCQASFLCLPVLMRLLPGLINPYGFVATAEGLVRLDFWSVTLALAFHLQHLLQNAPLRLVADAFFAKAPFINPLVEAGIHVISRLRDDGVGWDDPEPKGPHKRGPQKKKGREWKLARLLQEELTRAVTVTIYGKQESLWVAVRDVWLRGVARKVRVVVVQTAKAPLILVSTDLLLSAEQIISIYSARFCIELAFRELKQHMGLGDYQCTGFAGIYRFVHLSLVAYCLGKLALMQATSRDWLMEEGQSWDRKTTPLSFHRLTSRLRRFALKAILTNSATVLDFTKRDEVIKKVLRMAA